jgi:CBS domain-containing protein
MICPTCGFDNVPGSEYCQGCMQDLTQLDQPVAHDRVERSLMEETVRVLKPRPPVTLPPDVSVAEAIRTMLLRDIGALLIVDDKGKLLGIFSERDLLTKVAGSEDDYASRPVRDFMTPNPETVSADATLAFVLHKMDGGGYRHLPILREGRPTGMISVRDMLRHITKVCKHV